METDTLTGCGPGECVWSATPGELREHCAKALAKYKVPVAIEIREALPVNNLGKVLRRSLAAEEALRAARVGAPA